MQGEGENVEVDVVLEDMKTSLENEKLKGLKSLREIELEKMKACLSVEEYEAFLQRQRELLKCDHEDIKSEVVSLSFGHEHH